MKPASLIPRDFFEIYSEIILYGSGNSNSVFRSFVLDKISPKLLPTILLTVDQSHDDLPRVVDSSLHVSPKFLKINAASYLSIPIIICIGDSLVVKSVKDLLNSMGFENVLVMSDFQDYQCAYDTRESSLIRYDFENKYMDFRKKVFQSLQDDLSRVIFEKYISVYFNNMAPLHPCSDLRNEQIESNINFLTSLDCSTILNCGAYNGDTFSRLTNILPGKAKHVYLLEPSISNFNKLIGNLRKLRPSSEKITALPLGVGDKTSSLHMSSSSKGVVTSFNSTEVSADSAVIACIDDIFYGEKFTHFIVDIEGYEKNFLRGAAETISRCRPNICIATYHFPLDIIEIPMLLLELGYKIYLRNYSSHNPDTLIYAIPE